MFMAGPWVRGQPLTNAPPFKPSPIPLPAWFTNIPAGFSNAFNNISNSFAWGTNFWWTNTSTLSNAPAKGPTNTAPSHVVLPGNSPQPKLPTDVQTIVQQFQNERTLLEQNLNSADDAQRQQILQQLEALRQQLLEQVQSIRANLSQQTIEMQGQFNNQFGPINRGPGTATATASGPGSGTATGGGGPHKH
jgi:hypothetical protein